MITITQATISDSGTLSKLAVAIYQENYLYLWHEGGADWYMHEYAYAEDKIREELSDQNIGYYIVQEDAEPVGYLKLVLAGKMSGYDLTEALEIERIYLLHKMKGRGLGKRMMDLALDTARSMNKKILFLKAMDSSLGAINFYRKMGYEISDTFSLPMPTFSLMKETYRGMVVLIKKIAAENATV